MRVALDLTPLVAGDTGVARYASELWRALEADHADIEVRSFAVGRGPDPTRSLTRRVRVPLRVLQRCWTATGRPRAEDLVGPVDLVHSIDLQPPPTRRPLVMTTHDVLPLQRPELYEAPFVARSRAHARALHRAQVVVATCEATADDVAEVTGIDRSRIVVAPLGRRLGTPPEELSPVDGPYLLYVGAITPRKGLPTLARALHQLGTDAPPLLVAGPDGMAATAVRDEIDALGLGDRVRFLGRVSDTELATLLHHATLLCHPSEAEGFGIPVLEAMGAGTPVVAADIPSVREVTAGTAVLVPPRDVDALAAGLLRVLEDEVAAARLGAEGRARASSFTWEAMAARIADVYRSLA